MRKRINRKKLVAALEDILPMLDLDPADNHFDCFGCCGCCGDFYNNQEAVQNRLKEIVNELKGEN